MAHKKPSERNACEEHCVEGTQRRTNTSCAGLAASRRISPPGNLDRHRWLQINSGLEQRPLIDPGVSLLFCEHITLKRATARAVPALIGMSVSLPRCRLLSKSSRSAVCAEGLLTFPQRWQPREKMSSRTSKRDQETSAAAGSVNIALREETSKEM